MSDIKFKIGFDVDKGSLGQIKSEISQINKEIQSRGAESGFSKEMKEALKYTELVDKALNKATNNKLDKVNTKVFNDELKKSNITLAQMYAKLKAAGVDGSQAIRQLNRELRNTGVEVKESSKLLDEMFDTFGKTVKWGIASSAMNQITGSIQRAVGFTKALDDSLNQIRIVSGQSAGEMNSFAREANEAAKALGKTTTEYADASLLYFQQGKSASEVRQLTEATLMGANITGTEVSEMADMITSALNGYSMAADKAIFVTDTLAAIGAATGSDFEELATGMSKVASQAATVGVPFEKLNAMLATISETTREAPETIGTSLKTVFARMSEIKLEGSATDEDGVTMSLGKVQDALSLIDVSLLDTEGAMKDMGGVIEEIGGKWEGLNVETKSAITNALAGQRQASRLMALFNQWDRYEVALNSAMNATGATMEQNEIRMDSMSYKTQQMRAELERLWMNLINSDVLKSGVDAITSILEKVNSLTESLGGMSTLLTGLGGVLVAVFSKQIIGTLTDLTKGFSSVKTSIKEIGVLKGKGAPTEKEKDTALEKKVKKGLSDEEFGQYKKEKGRLQDIQLEVDSNERLIELKRNKLDLDKQYIQIGKETKNIQENQQELQTIKAKKKALEGVFELEQMMEAYSLGDENATYEEFIATLKDSEVALTGMSREALEAETSFDDLKASIKEFDKFYGKGFFPSVDKEITTLEGYNKELKGIKKEAKETEAAIEKITEETHELNKVKIRQGETVKGYEGKGLKGLKTENIVKGLGAVSLATATAMPLIQALGDKTASTSDKLDAGANSAFGLATSLLMTGNPIAMVVGGLAGLAGVALKITKNFQAYDKAVKKNAETIEKYKNRTSELNGEISTLENQTGRLTDLQRELALVGGDLNKLTVEQQDAYRNLGNEIAETTPEMIAYYDSEGNAILKANASLDEYMKKKKKSLGLAQKAMIANKESFLLEYSHDIQLNEDRLKAEEEKVRSLEEELENLKSSGASEKKIKKKTEEIETSIAEVDDLRGSLENLDKNIQENIINPFMLASEEITKVDDAVKQVVSATYELEDVQKVMDRYQYKWDMVNGQPEKVKRSYKEMADLTNKELERMEEKAETLALALNSIKKGTDAEGEVGETYRKMYNSLVTADQATQAYIGTVSTLGFSLEGTQQILADMATTIDEFGLAKPVDIDTVLPIAKKETADKIRSTRNQINGLNIALRKANAVAEDIAVKQEAVLIEPAMFSDMPTVQYRYEDTPEYAEAKKKIAEVEQQIAIATEEQNQAKIEQNDIVNNSIVKQQELNREYEKYLMGIASTPEGMNRIINSYNVQYEQMKAINELMTEGSVEKQTVPGEVDSETGEVGEPTEIEVESFEDSALGQYFYEFQSVLTGMIDEDFVSFEDSVNELMSYGQDAAQDTIDKFQEMGQTLQDLPAGVLEGFKEISPEIADEIDDVVKNGAKASEDSIAAVSSAVEKQNQKLGRMYAVINKDSTSYFKDFTDQNKRQVQLVGIATGVMADDYATYAEYTAAQDQWMADNSVWLSNEQASSSYWAAVQGINAKAEEARQTGWYGDQMVTASEIDGLARADASRAAAFASVIAEGEAAKLKNQVIIDSINAIPKDGKIFGAAAEAAQEELKRMEREIGLIDAVIAGAQAELNKIAGSYSGGDTTTTTGLGNFNYSTGGGNVKPVPTAPPKPGPASRPDLGGGGPSSDKGGGGGGAEEKEVEDLEWEEDIYHDINIQLEKKQQLLDKLQKQQDKLYGKEYLDNLAAQRQAMLEEQKLLEKKLEMQKQDAKNQAEALKKQGVQFNVDGTIANYNELLRQKLAYVNSLSGEAKEAAKEEFQSLVDSMEKYEDLIMNAINESETAIQDSIDAQREIWLEEFTYGIEIKIDLSEDFKDALDYMKEMNDEFEDYSENYERTKEQITEQLDLIGRLKDKLEEINNNPDLTEKERLELLEKYNEELMEAVKDLKDLDETLTKLFEDTLKDGLDLVKEHIDEFKNLNDQLKHYEQTLKLIGEGDNFEVLDSIYEAQYSNIMGQIGTLNSVMASLQSQRDALKAAGMEGTDEWKAIDDAIKDTQKDINKLAQESLKLLQDEFKNSVDEIMSSLEEQMSGGSTLSELKKQQSELKEERKKYLDGEEKLLAVSKLQQKVQKEIDETDDPKKKAQLQKFMDSELAKLKEKDQLTKYDVDRANLIYDLTLKQMALDDQRATKNIMRLVRDTQGNWVYEFTEDAKAIEKAQEDVSSAMEKLMELDKKKLEETQDLMLKLQEEYFKEVQQIAKDAANGKYKTEEELRQALQAANDRYNQKMTEAQFEYEEVKQNATLSSMAVIVESFLKTGDVLGNLTEEQEKLLTALAEKTDGSYLEMAETINGLLSGNPDSIKATLEELGFTTEEEMGKIMDSLTGENGLINNMQDNWGLSVSDMISDFVGSGGFKESIDTALESLMGKWNEYQGKIDEVQSATGTDLDSIKNGIGDIDSATESLIGTTGDLINKFDEEMTAIAELTTAYQKNREEIQSTISDMLKYIETINKAIDAIQRKADAEAEAAKPPAPAPKPPTPAPTPTPPAPTGPSWGGSDLKAGMKVRVKAGTRGFYDSFGRTPSTAAFKENTAYLVDDYGIYRDRPQGIHLSNSSGGDLGWVAVGNVAKFDTGGYTGSWGSSEGKMAMLHEKEIVLNKQDTQNILSAISMLRDANMANIIRKFTPSASSYSTNSYNNSTSQNITINADFSGVSSSNEIERAFENMANMASQYANRR